MFRGDREEGDFMSNIFATENLREIVNIVKTTVNEVRELKELLLVIKGNQTKIREDLRNLDHLRPLKK